MTTPHALGFHMGQEGFDDWGYPSGAEIAASKFGALNAYLAGGTAITPTILHDLTAHGIYVWLTWELSATAPEGGAAQAQVDAQQALAAVHALHLPVTKGVAIYGTNDSVVTSWAAVEAYFVRWAALIGGAGYEPGIYANSTVTDYMVQHRVPLTRFWQTGAGSPGGVIVSYADIYQGAPNDARYPQEQSFGRTVDVDAILSPNFGGVNYSGLWTPPPPPPPPKPTPPPPPPPNPTPTPVDGDTVHLHPINISTDAHGDGFHLCVDLPWSTFVAVTHQGTTAASHFSAGEAHANQVNGHIALSVTGAAPNAVATVLLTATV